MQIPYQKKEAIAILKQIQLMTVQYVFQVQYFLNTYSLIILDNCVIILDSLQCGPYVDLPHTSFTSGQYCYRGGPDEVCWGRSNFR